MSMDMNEEMLPERLLKAGEVAEILNISKAFAYHLIRQGKLRSVAIEGARRVRRVDLEAYIEENLTPYRVK